jgi:nucleoside phosphorylase
MSPLPDYLDLVKYKISPADVVRLFLRCDPEDVRENVVITPVWYRDLTATHGRVVREVSERVLEVDYRGISVTVIRSDIGAPNTGDVVLALGATGCRRLVFTGSVGGLEAALQIGELVLALESITGDGFSRYLNPEIVPGDRLFERAKPDTSLTSQLGETANEVCTRDSIALHRGTVFSIDSIVAQFSRIDYMRHELDCIGIEMETAATFHAARLVGIQAAALLMVSDVIPMKKSLFSGRTKADRARRRAVRRNQLPEAILRTLLH